MAIQRTSIDNPEGTVTPIIGEEDVDEYMFFQNLKMIQECVNSMLSMDPKRVNAILMMLCSLFSFPKFRFKCN